MTTTLLPVNSILNPRDLGGIVGLDGRKIKTHRLIRTGTLTRMSDEDIQFLKNYGLTTIIDLRVKGKTTPIRKLKVLKIFPCLFLKKKGL